MKKILIGLILVLVFFMCSCFSPDETDDVDSCVYGSAVYGECSYGE